MAASGDGDDACGAADVGDLTTGFCVGSDGVGEGAVGWDVEVGGCRQSISGLTGGGCGCGGSIGDGDAASAVGDGDARLLVLRREGVVECHGDLCVQGGAHCYCYSLSLTCFERNAAGTYVIARACSI